MDDGELPIEGEDESIRRRIIERSPDPPTPGHGDFLVYVMGPYTPFDLSYAYPESDLDTPYVDSELFDPERHADMEATLKEVCSMLRAEPGVRAFVATDVGVPTERDVEEVDRKVRGLSPLDQSIEYARVSDAVAFVLDEAGRNAGVASEIGAILGEFDLRLRNSDRPRKPRRRFRIYVSETFSSASIEEIPHGFGVDIYRYESESDLLANLRHFISAVEYASRHESFPRYRRSDD